MEVYLIRHTRVATSQSVCYGASDVELASTYENDRQILADKLKFTDKSLVYSSPLKRCQQLAKDIFGDKTNVDNRLQEYDFGDWELKRWDSIPKTEMDFWGKDFVHHRPPNGENMEDVVERVSAFWNELLENQRSKDTSIFVVSHSGAIRALICYLLEIPLKNAFQMGLDFGSVTKVSVYEQYLTVDYINR